MKKIQKIIVLFVFTLTTISLTAGAFAHVEIDPDTATKGSSGTFTINVPNESSSANTIKVEISFPQDTPIKDAIPTLFDSWAVQSEYSADGKYINKLTLSGDKIEGTDELGFVFDITGLPGNTDQVLFKVVQTYDDGRIDRWVDEPLASGDEPEFPAAVLKLTGENVEETTVATKTKTTTSIAPDESESKDENDNPSTIIYVLIGAVLVLILILGIRFFLKNSKPTNENQASSEE